MGGGIDGQWKARKTGVLFSPLPTAHWKSPFDSHNPTAPATTGILSIHFLQ
jgi:hypothetical protein